MNILTIDTALQGCVVGLYNTENKDLEQRVLKTSRAQAEHLVPMIQEIITDYNEISLIATTLGPGAFVGIRIGMMSAKMFAMILDIPLIGVSTLHAMYEMSDQKEKCIAVLETKRQDYYVEFFSHPRIEEASCMNAEEIVDQTNNESWHIIGNANERLKKETNSPENLIFQDVELIYPKVLAIKALEQYETKNFQGNLEPLYLRAPEIGKPKISPRKIAQEK